MTKLEKLFIEHKVVSDGLYRKYLIDAIERRYDLESSRPFYLHILDSSDPVGEIIVSNGWIQLLKKTIGYLQNVNKKSNEDLLAFKVDWSKSVIFSNRKSGVNSCQLENGLFLNINHTSVHIQWLISDLLQFYGIKTAYLLIHRSQNTEPEDIKNEIILSRKKDFQEYSNKQFGNSDKVIRTIDVVNKVFYKMGYPYYNFYLFDNKHTLSAYKKIFLERCKKHVFWDERQKAFIDRCLAYLGCFLSQITVSESVVVQL